MHPVSWAVSGLRPWLSGPHPSAVLLHGFGETMHSQWLQPGWAAALLSRGHAAMAWDLPGHGTSAAINSAARSTPEVLRRDTLDLLDAAEVERAAIVGHSLGARIALDLALAEPARVKGLVLLGVGTNLLAPFAGSALADALATAASGMPVDTPWQPLVAALRSMGADLHALAAAAGAPRRTFTPQELARIDVPVLVLAGTHDAVVGDAEAFARMLPFGTFVNVEGADHATLTRHADALLTATLYIHRLLS
jgi:pimeloyl-ACP methyl ester carboxylesterase